MRNSDRIPTAIKRRTGLLRIQVEDTHRGKPTAECRLYLRTVLKKANDMRL